MTFAVAHIAASCSSQPDGPESTFVVAGIGLTIGSVVAGILSDRIGRALTAKLLFGFGVLACAASVAAHPDDEEILLILAMAAGAAAGGSHVAAELLLEKLPKRYRAFILLSYPALFFPVGLVQFGVEGAGWTSALVGTFFVVLAAGIGLLFLPESEAFLVQQHAQAAERFALQQAQAEAEAAAVANGIPRGYSLNDDISSQTRTARCLKPLASSVNSVRALCMSCDRGLALTGCMWMLFTVCYYLTSLTLLVPGTPAGPFDGDEQLASYQSPLCPAYVGYGSNTTAAAPIVGAGGRRMLPAVPAYRSSSCPNPHPVLYVFHSGTHLVIAEMVALLIVAFMVNTQRMGRKFTLSFTFGVAAMSMVLAAATNPSFGCEGSLERALVEFFVRLSLAACAQALFIYTLELCSTSIRSTVAGICIALFRIGALVTLAANIAPDEADADARLQWSVYALQYEYGLFGLRPETAAHTTAVTAVLAACSQACLLCSCLAACLPVDTRRKSLSSLQSAAALGASNVVETSTVDTTALGMSAGVNSDEDERTIRADCAALFASLLTSCAHRRGSADAVGTSLDADVGEGIEMRRMATASSRGAALRTVAAAAVDVHDSPDPSQIEKHTPLRRIVSGARRLWAGRGQPPPRAYAAISPRHGGFGHPDSAMDDDDDHDEQEEEPGHGGSGRARAGRYADNGAGVGFDVRCASNVAAEADRALDSTSRHGGTASEQHRHHFPGRVHRASHLPRDAIAAFPISPGWESMLQRVFRYHPKPPASTADNQLSGPRDVDDAELRERARTISLVDAADLSHDAGLRGRPLSEFLDDVVNSGSASAASRAAALLDRYAFITDHPHRQHEAMLLDTGGMGSAHLREEAARLRLLARVWVAKDGASAGQGADV